MAVIGGKQKKFFGKNLECNVSNKDHRSEIMKFLVGQTEGADHFF